MPADGPVPVDQLPAAVRELTADRRRQLEAAPNPRAAERLERMWALGSKAELTTTRARARDFVQSWKDDHDTAEADFVTTLATAQSAAHKKSGPARRRLEREAARRGRSAPVRRHDRLGSDPRQDQVDAEDLMSEMQRAELAAVRNWVRDWDADRPTDNTVLTVDEAATVAASLRSPQSLAKSLERARTAWGALTPTEAPLAAANAPTATPGPPASESPANNVGARGPKHKKPADQTADRRDSHHQLREHLKGHRTTDRLKECGVKPNAGGDVVIRAAKSGVAHFAGLQTCASVWACPVCGPKIRAARASELEAFATAWIARGGTKKEGKKPGGGLLFGTFTFQHHRRLDLDPLLDKLAAAWRRMITYKRFRRLRDETGMVGYTRAEELTHARNGWHPHLHVLFWLPEHMSQEDADELRVELYDMWKIACKAEGLGEPSEKHGVDLRTVARGKEGAKQLARYVAKIEGPDGVERAMGNEMMRGDLKTGRRAESRTPFEIAKDWMQTGSKRDHALWLEYERATHGHKAVTWSKGLKNMLQELLDIVEDSRTSEEIAAEEDPDATGVARIPRDTWYQHITHHPGRRLQLLRAYERLGMAGLKATAELWGLTWGTHIIPTPPPAEAVTVTA